MIAFYYTGAFLSLKSIKTRFLIWVYLQVLKREIDVSHLRWYGYCMFKALQALHKQVKHYSESKLLY
jgi:hypothetical protein